MGKFLVLYFWGLFARFTWSENSYAVHSDCTLPSGTGNYARGGPGVKGVERLDPSGVPWVGVAAQYAPLAVGLATRDPSLGSRLISDARHFT